MTFEELVKSAEGDKKLAFARGDVDNLGLIFMQGLGEDYSISRIATLSRSLDLYFSGYFNYLFNLEEFKNKIYILYAGGDDFFIIGPWDKVFDALKRIREDFKKYTCNNKDIELSSGVFVGRDSYPVRFAGELAGSEEDKAKEIKPAIRVLGESLKWDEYEKAIEEAEEMVNLVKNRKIGRSLFYKFYQLLNSFKENENKISPKFYPQFYYYLYRNVKDEKDREQVIGFFLDTGKDYQVKKDALFKAKYIIMKTRE
jgi:CRISPR-associated protein Csm1